MQSATLTSGPSVACVRHSLAWCTLPDTLSCLLFCRRRRHNYHQPTNRPTHPLNEQILAKLQLQLEQGPLPPTLGTELLAQGGSYGNGGAMRVAPLGLVYRNAALPVLEAALRQSLVPTHHTHPWAVEGALTQALAVAYLSKQQPPTQQQQQQEKQPPEGAQQLLSVLQQQLRGRSELMCSRLATMQEGLKKVSRRRTDGRRWVLLWLSFKRKQKHCACFACMTELYSSACHMLPTFCLPMYQPSACSSFNHTATHHLGRPKTAPPHVVRLLFLTSLGHRAVCCCGCGPRRGRLQRVSDQGDRRSGCRNLGARCALGGWGPCRRHCGRCALWWRHRHDCVHDRWGCWMRAWCLA